MTNHPKRFMHPWTWNGCLGKWVKPTKRIAWVRVPNGPLLFEVVENDRYEETMARLQIEADKAEKIILEYIKTLRIAP